MIREYPDQSFVLIKDIDLSGINNFKPIGNEDAPFEGFFNGNRKTIKNLKINRPKEDNVGLFGVVVKEKNSGFFGTVIGDTVLKNIKLENVDVNGKNKVGGLVGWISGVAVNINIQGKVKGENKVGGMVGDGGRIENSQGNVSVMGINYVGGLMGYGASVDNSYAMGRVRGEKHVGGLAGYSAGVYNSYVTGNVIGNNEVGGLIGVTNGSAVNSYVTGQVKGEKDVGGLIGKMDGRDIQNCYIISKVSGIDRVGAFIGYVASFAKFKGKSYWVVGSAKEKFGYLEYTLESRVNLIRKTKAQLKNLTIRSAGWDEKIWVFEKGKYPRLFWEK